MIIRNLAGILRCDGFVAKKGRHPQSCDYWIERGPVDIAIDGTGCIRSIINLNKSTRRPRRGNGFSAGGEEENSSLRSSRASVQTLRLGSGSAGLEQDTDVGDDRVIDGTGLLATSAFVDAHTHAIHAGSRAGEYFQRWAGATYLDIAKSGGGIVSTITAVEGESEESLTRALISRLERCAALGSALVEVKSGYAASAEGELRMLRAITRARDVGFDIYRTFMPLHTIPSGLTEAAWVEQMMGLLPIVAEQKLADGVDAFVDKGFFSIDSSYRFFSEARKFGFQVRAHCDELANIGATFIVVNMGGLSVDHLQHIRADALMLWPQASTVATLLPATSFYLGLPFADARRLIDRGAPVALATDYNPGTAPSPSMLFTMLLAARHLKMTPSEIWCASTYNGAQALGRHDQGWIGDGNQASLCLWPDHGHTEADAFVAELVVHQTSPRHTISGNRVFDNAG